MVLGGYISERTLVRTVSEHSKAKLANQLSKQDTSTSKKKLSSNNQTNNQDTKMGAVSKIVMSALLLFVCYIQLSQGNRDNCTRSNVQKVRDLLDLTERIFDANKASVRFYNHPSPLSVFYLSPVASHYYLHIYIYFLFLYQEEELHVLPQKLKKSGRITGHTKNLSLANNLLSLISQRERLMEMEDDTQIVVVLKTIIDTLYNDTCKFVSH